MGVAVRRVRDLVGLRGAAARYYSQTREANPRATKHNPSDQKHQKKQRKTAPEARRICRLRHLIGCANDADGYALKAAARAMVRPHRAQCHFVVARLELVAACIHMAEDEAVGPRRGAGLAD